MVCISLDAIFWDLIVRVGFLVCVLGCFGCLDLLTFYVETAGLSRGVGLI